MKPIVALLLSLIAGGARYGWRMMGGRLVEVLERMR
jgi:hypothetical protein